MPHFLPTIPVAEAIVSGVPMELFELSKAQVKPVETDTPDVELFRASHRDDEDDDDDDDEDNEQHHRGESSRHDKAEDEEDGEDDDNDDDHDDDDGEEEATSGLDFIAKSIVAHAKNVFSDTSSNTISNMDEEEGGASVAPSSPASHSSSASPEVRKLEESEDD